MATAEELLVGIGLNPSSLGELAASVKNVVNKVANENSIDVKVRVRDEKGRFIGGGGGSGSSSGTTDSGAAKATEEVKTLGHAFAELHQRQEAEKTSWADFFSVIGNGVKKVAVELAVLGASITAFFHEASHEAAGDEDALARLKTVFKDLAGDAEAFAKQQAETNALLTEGGIQEAISRFQSIGESLLGSRKEAFEMSKEMAALGNSLSLAFNQDFDVVMDNLTTALLRSGRAVRQYGIDVSETRIKQEALRMGIDDQSEAFTPALQAQIKMNIILKEGAAALEGSTGKVLTFNQQIKAMKAQTAELMSQIGAFVNEAILPFIKKITEVVEWMRRWVSAHPDAVRSFVQLGAVIAVLGTVLTAVIAKMIIFNSLTMLTGTANVGLAAGVAQSAMRLTGFQIIVGKLIDVLGIGLVTAFGLAAAAAASFWVGYKVGEALGDALGLDKYFTGAADAANKAAKATQEQSKELLALGETKRKLDREAKVAAAALAEQNKITAKFRADIVSKENQKLTDEISSLQAQVREARFKAKGNDAGLSDDKASQEMKNLFRPVEDMSKLSALERKQRTTAGAVDSSKMDTQGLIDRRVALEKLLAKEQDRIAAQKEVRDGIEETEKAAIAAEASLADAADTVIDSLNKEKDAREGEMRIIQRKAETDMMSAKSEQEEINIKRRMTAELAKVELDKERDRKEAIKRATEEVKDSEMSLEEARAKSTETLWDDLKALDERKKKELELAKSIQEMQMIEKRYYNEKLKLIEETKRAEREANKEKAKAIKDLAQGAKDTKDRKAGKDTEVDARQAESTLRDNFKNIRSGTGDKSKFDKAVDDTYANILADAESKVKDLERAAQEAADQFKADYRSGKFKSSAERDNARADAEAKQSQAENARSKFERDSSNIEDQKKKIKEDAQGDVDKRGKTEAEEKAFRDKSLKESKDFVGPPAPDKKESKGPLDDLGKSLDDMTSKLGEAAKSASKDLQSAAAQLPEMTRAMNEMAKGQMEVGKAILEFATTTVTKFDEVSKFNAGVTTEIKNLNEKLDKMPVSGNNADKEAENSGNQP